MSSANGVASKPAPREPEPIAVVLDLTADLLLVEAFMPGADAGFLRERFIKETLHQATKLQGKNPSVAETMLVSRDRQQLADAAITQTQVRHVYPSRRPSADARSFATQHAAG